MRDSSRFEFGKNLVALFGGMGKKSQQKWSNFIVRRHHSRDNVLPSFLHAATFFVSTVSQLETALATAESNSEDDTINIAAGTYNLTESLSYDSQKFNEKQALSRFKHWHTELC